jgi:kinetochore protein Nuf2
VPGLVCPVWCGCRGVSHSLGMNRGRSFQGSAGGSFGAAGSGAGTGASAGGAGGAVQPPAFPKMPLDEIVEDMALFKRPVSRELIRNPTPDGVRGVFLFFLEHVYAVSDEEIRQPSFGCLDSLAYPDLHDESIPILHFLRASQKMFAAAQYHDFGLRDFTQPTPARFHWQLSALINYAKFRENRLRFFSEMSMASEQLRETRAELANQQTDIKGRISAIEEVRASEEPAIAKEKEFVGELSAELSALHKQQVNLTDEMREKKNLLQATVEKIASLKFQDLAASQELESLKECVVSSPDRVKAEIKENSERVEYDKENIQTLQRQTHDIQARAETIGKASQDIQGICMLVEEAVTQMEHVKAMELREKEQKAKIREFENEKESLESSNKHLDRQIKSIEQRLARVRQQRDELTERSRENDKMLSDQSSEADREKAEAERAIAGNNERAAKISRQIHRLVEAFVHDVDVVNEKLAVVDKKMKSFFKDVKETDALVETENRKALNDLRVATADVFDQRSLDHVTTKVQ